MFDLLLVPVAILYVAIVLALLVFGVNFSYLTWTAFRVPRRSERTEALTDLPTVTIQLPIFNERYVAERVLAAVTRIEYPIDRYRIQVLDDSTDDTTEIIARFIAPLTEAGVPIDHIHRTDRQGYKAGALQNGLSITDSEYIAIFDADFVPESEFLLRTIPTLVSDDSIAFVQTRWGHLNRGQSLLTQVQALSIDGHFRIEQQARSVRGHCFNFNGTAGVWRRQAIDDAGGWSQRTLTEDLDLSYRAFLNGWRAAYLDDYEVPAEVPVSFEAYRRQQYRWARGSFQCAALLIPRVWSSDFRRMEKLQATLHLSGYAIHLLLLGMVGIFPAVLQLSGSYPTLLSLFGTMAILNLAALAPSAMFLSAQHLSGRKWYVAIPLMLVLTLLGVGMMVNSARAAAGAISGKAGVFNRTAKFGAEGSGPRWQRLGYRSRIEWAVLLEVATAVLCGWTAWRAVNLGSWAIAGYTLIFGAGLLFNAGLTIGQAGAVASRRLIDRGAERRSNEARLM